MIRNLTRYAAVLAAFALFPLGAEAQQGGAPVVQPDTQQVRGWLTELQQVHDRLQQIQAKALQQSELQARQEALGERIKTAMEEQDPTLELSLARVEELEQEAAKARQAGDQAALQKLGAEAQEIQQQFMLAQQAALEKPEISSAMEAFQADLEEQMVEVDPQTPQLVARLQELEQKLSAVMQGR